MSRRVVAWVASVVTLAVATTGYAVADVLDVAPGILTRDRPLPAPTATAPADIAARALPTPTLTPSPPATADSTTVAPTAAGLKAALAGPLTDPALGPDVAMSVRDGVTGEVLYGRGATTPHTPASTAKVLSALAIATSLDLDSTMPTRVVALPGTKDLVLVAHGDTLLAKGRGGPGVIGRAGLADLADEVATNLTAGGRTSVRLRLDLSYAVGPRYPATWSMADVNAGFTQGVTMIGRGDQLPEPYKPSPARPEREVATTLVQLLTARGVTVTLQPEATWAKPAPEGAELLGEVHSAAYEDVVALALQTSDNALTENLVRQAAAAQGVPTKTGAASGAFIAARLREAGISTAGLKLLDGSGLSHGQTATAQTLSEVLALAAAGTVPGLRELVADLPVAGLSGTLADRFDAKGTRPAAGLARAKTGTLNGVSSLAGTTTTREGRPLLFVVLADQVPPASGTLAARAALDRVVTALTECGCR